MRSLVPGMNFSPWGVSQQFLNPVLLFTSWTQYLCKYGSTFSGPLAVSVLHYRPRFHSGSWQRDSAIFSTVHLPHPLHPALLAQPGFLLLFALSSQIKMPCDSVRHSEEEGNCCISTPQLTKQGHSFEYHLTHETNSLQELVSFCLPCEHYVTAFVLEPDQDFSQLIVKL